MSRAVLIILLMLLTAFVLYSAARIEVLNMRAGNYLPRRDRAPDGTLTDGKISRLKIWPATCSPQS